MKEEQKSKRNVIHITPFYSSNSEQKKKFLNCAKEKTRRPTGDRSVKLIFPFDCEQVYIDS